MLIENSDADIRKFNPHPTTRPIGNRNMPAPDFTIYGSPSPRRWALRLVASHRARKAQAGCRLPCDINFEVRQIMYQIVNGLQRRRHFCFDANPYGIARRGLRRNRNVWAAVSSELSHFELESTLTTSAGPTTIRLEPSGRQCPCDYCRPSGRSGHGARPHSRPNCGRPALVTPQPTVTGLLHLCQNCLRTTPSPLHDQERERRMIRYQS